MIKFLKIRQFRDLIRTVRERHDFKGLDADENPIFEHTSEYPKLSFTGTVKIHGTNASIVINDDIQFQSRNRVITINSDNKGFAAFADKTNKKIKLKKYFGDNIVIFGEWCGEGIQKGVAVSKLPRMFVVFELFSIDSSGNTSKKDFNELKLSDSYIKELNDSKIFFIDQFPTFNLEVDFESFETAQDKIIELVDKVENECPVGKFFNVSGVGEGIVWKCVERESSEYWMKTKGIKHTVTKTKTIAPCDIEMMNNINEFVDATVTENRLNQGLEFIKEQGLTVDKKNTGVFVKWVINDILDEEADTIKGNNLLPKPLNKFIGNKARVFWFQECEKF